MEHNYLVQASSFLIEGTISLDDIRMSLESSPDEESRGFDMTSYLNYEVLHFLIKAMRTSMLTEIRPHHGCHSKTRQPVPRANPQVAISKNPYPIVLDEHRPAKPKTPNYQGCM